MLYKNAMKGDNGAFKLLRKISVMSERKGITGKHVEFIEKTYAWVVNQGVIWMCVKWCDD